MFPKLVKNGFLLLWHEEPEEQKAVYDFIRGLGWEPWDRNGMPVFVVLQANASKPQWFEAGFLAGAGVPLFMIGRGGGFRKKHQETIQRLGGWAIHMDRREELPALLARRGIVAEARN